jgi:thioredoxin 1
MTPFITITEATFGRHTRAAACPLVVRFGTPACAACRAMTPVLKEMAHTYAERLRVGTINIGSAPFLAEQYTIEASPTLAIFDQGELVTRIVGFAQAGLLRLLFSQVAQGTLAADSIWRPTEQVFEDTVIVPLLQAWGLSYQRQVHCSFRAGRTTRHGRVDFLVYDPSMTQPLTLFENKRLITSAQDLGQAVMQAHAYAQALRVASFVVAAPSGMWIYALDGAQARCVRTVTSLEVHRHPSAIQQLLLQLYR